MDTPKENITDRQKSAFRLGNECGYALSEVFKTDSTLDIKIFYKGYVLGKPIEGEYPVGCGNNGQLYIKISSVPSCKIFLEGNWDNVKILESEYQKALDVVNKNKIKDAVDATREEPVFEFLEENRAETKKDKLSEVEKIVRDLFTTKLQKIEPYITSEKDNQLMRLILTGRNMQRTVDSSLLKKIPIKEGKLTKGLWAEVGLNNQNLKVSIAKDVVAFVSRQRPAIGLELAKIKFGAARLNILVDSCSNDIYFEVVLL